MPNASGASKVRTTAPSPSFGSGRCGSSASTERLSQRTNVCSHTRASDRADPPSGLGPLAATGEPELVRVLGQRVDHELQVLVEGHAGLGLQLLRAAIDVVPVHTGRETWLLQLLLDRL